MPYMVPSENGGKADVRWMALRRGEAGAGLLLQAETGTVFEVCKKADFAARPLFVGLPLAPELVDLAEQIVVCFAEDKSVLRRM